MVTLLVVLRPVLSGMGTDIEVKIGTLGVLLAAGGILAALLGGIVCMLLKGRPALRFGPLLVTVLALALSAFCSKSLFNHAAQWNFRSRFDRRHELVRVAAAGALHKKYSGPCDCYYAELPEGFRNLSAGGEVLVSKHGSGYSVTFFVWRGFYFPDDNYNAFIYRSDSDPPRTGTEDTDRFTSIEPIQPNWYFVRHT